MTASRINNMMLVARTYKGQVRFWIEWHHCASSCHSLKMQQSCKECLLSNCQWSFESHWTRYSALYRSTSARHSTCSIHHHLQAQQCSRLLMFESKWLLSRDTHHQREHQKGRQLSSTCRLVRMDSAQLNERGPEIVIQSQMNLKNTYWFSHVQR